MRRFAAVACGAVALLGCSTAAAPGPVAHTALDTAEALVASDTAPAADFEATATWDTPDLGAGVPVDAGDVATGTADGAPEVFGPDTALFDAVPDATDPSDTPADTPPALEVAAEVSAVAAPGLALQVNGAGLGAATLYIFALPVSELASAGGPKPGSAVIAAQLPGIKPPYTGTVNLPKGDWVVGALLSKSGFDPFMATGVAFGCADGKPWAIQSDGTTCQPASLTLTLSPPEATPPIATLCGSGGGPSTGAPVGMLSEAFAATPPSTQAGGAHLLDGRQIGGMYWVAGHQDGWVSFELSPGSTPVDLAGWKTQGQGLCSRLARVGNRLWCTTRRPATGWTQINPLTGTATTFGTVQVPSGQLLDGVAPLADRVLFAAHAAGLVTLLADPPFTPLPLTISATLDDPWDVAAVGSDVLAVADGKGGLKVLAVATSPLQLQQVAAVALPGLSGWLGVVGKQVLVGSPSGYLHVVDLTVPTAPVVQGQLVSPWPVWGVAAAGGRGFAAAGALLWGVDLPKPGAVVGKLKLRAAERSWHYALDVDPFGPAASATQLVTAEFAAVRLLDIDAKVLAGPMVVAPKAVFSKPTAVGGQLQGKLLLRNFGPASALVTEVLWLEDDKAGAPPAKLALGGLPITVPAGGQVVLSLQATKAIKGASLHLIKLQTPLGEHVVQWQEVTHLLPGDPLPPLAYQDATKQLININAALQGKPGVVMVAAHACPVALASLAAMAQALQPLVAQGKVAAVAIDPWDKPDLVPEMAVITANFPILFSPLTTNDSHGYSALLQDVLAQPTNNAAPMPIVYVLDSKGIIVDARQGWEPAALAEALQSLGVAP